MYKSYFGSPTLEKRMAAGKKKANVINLFGGPGAGKSTLAAHVFYEMKCAGYVCELVTEYAKNLVWRDMHSVMHDELYIFAKQQHYLRMTAEKVDWIITDSPIILPIIYDEEKSLEFAALVLKKFNGYNNFNFFLNRTKPYVEVGRTQTEDEARDLDVKIRNMLTKYSIPFQIILNPTFGWGMIREELRL